MPEQTETATGPALTLEDDALLQQWFHNQAVNSCVDFCANVVINSSPPRRFDCVVEQWQAEIIGTIAPAIEFTAGLIPAYDGPRRFFFVLPKGHDKTSLIGRLATWALGYARQPISASSSAGDKDQAKLVREAMEKELHLNPWVPVELNNYQAKGPGGRLDILSADAPTSSGRFDDLIVMDELTFWPRRELFDILISGAHKRPRSVVVIITNAGIKGSWQWQVLEAAKLDPLWHVYEAPPFTKLASWLSDAEVSSQRAMMTRNHAMRVYDNLWTDAAETPLLSWDEIQACHGKPLWRIVPTDRDKCGNLYVGVDVGRTRDLTVISVIEDIGQRLKLRELVCLADMPFDDQEREIAKRINRHVRAIRIDKGGIGMQLAERFERKHAGICVGVACGMPWQGQAGLKMLTAFREKRIEIPNDSDLNIDLQLVEEVGVSKGGVPVLDTQRSAVGHADRFWSIALALDAVPVLKPQVASARPRAILFGGLR